MLNHYLLKEKSKGTKTYLLLILILRSRIYLTLSKIENFRRIRQNDLKSMKAKFHRSCHAEIFKPNNTPLKLIDPRTINPNDAMDQIIDYIDDHPSYQFFINKLMN